MLDDRPATFQEYKCCSLPNHEVLKSTRPDQTQHSLMKDTKCQERGSSRVVRQLVSTWNLWADAGPFSEFKQNSCSSRHSSDGQLPTLAPQELLQRLGAEAKTLCRIRLSLGCQAELVSRSPRPDY